MLYRKENHFLQLFFCLFKTPDVFPFHVWYFNMSLSERSRVHASHCEFEVLLTYSHCLENLGVNLFSLDVNNVHLLSYAL